MYACTLASAPQQRGQEADLLPGRGERAPLDLLNLRQPRQAVLRRLRRRQIGIVQGGNQLRHVHRIAADAAACSIASVGLSCRISGVPDGRLSFQIRPLPFTE